MRPCSRTGGRQTAVLFSDTHRDHMGKILVSPIANSITEERAMAYRGRDRRGTRGGRGGRVRHNRHICAFCVDRTEIDYKNAELLRGFLTPRGHILPRRRTGTIAPRCLARRRHRPASRPGIRAVRPASLFSCTPGLNRHDWLGPSIPRCRDAGHDACRIIRRASRE